MERFTAGLPLRATRSDLRAPTGVVRSTHPGVDRGVAATLQGGGTLDTTSGGGSLDTASASSSFKDADLDTKSSPSSFRAADCETFLRLHRQTHSPPGFQSLVALNVLTVKRSLFQEPEANSAPAPKRLKATFIKAAAVPSESEDSSEEVDLPACVPDCTVPTKQTRFPVRVPYARGSAVGLDEADADQDACDRIQDLKWAASGAHSRRSRESWWLRRAAQRDLEAYPLNPDSLRLAAGLLRKGGYRSAEMYLSTFKNAHVRLGYHWTEQLALEHTECIRAVRRGLGPPRRADALPLDDIGSIRVQEEDPLETPHTLAVSRDVAIVSSWWMLREIELAAATIGQLTIEARNPEGSPNGLCGRAVFNLPVSKSDYRALGKIRTHNCACPSPVCPVAAAQRLRARAIALAARGRKALPTAPLVPTPTGEHQTKAQVVAMYQSLVDKVGSSHLRITGHSPRVTGAQRMALAGISEWRIQTFGRWGSSAVLAYIRETLIQGKGDFLAAEVEAAALVPLSGSLQEVVKLAAPDLAPEWLNPDLLLERVDRALEKHFEGDVLHKKWEGELKESLLEQVRTMMVPIQSEVDELSRPKAVRNNLSNVVHLVRTSIHTQCGWMWADHLDSVTPTQLDAEGFWCKRCCRVGDQLGGKD
jgi:hypothetical protein